MCDAEVEEITIPVIDQPGVEKPAYKITCKEFKVGARKTYDYYTDKDLAYYIASRINQLDDD